MLFREILGREPTSADLQAFVRQARVTRIPEAVETLLHELLRGPEASFQIGPRLLGQALDPAQADSERVAHAISLGTHCYTSSLLSRLELKPFSTPFDWIFSNLGMIAHCLQDDFRVFLSREYFATVPVEQRVDGPEVNLCEHTFYLKEFGQRFVFNHTDPTTEDGYSYLVRCVERMRRVLASSERKLFVCVVPKSSYSAASLQQLYDALSARTTRFELLGVVVGEPDANALVPTISPLGDVAGVQLYEQRPVSALGGVRFGDPVDEVPIVRLLRRKVFRLRSEI
jgi:hypothetical protein